MAHLSPVRVAGSTISRATLHNADEIARKDIRVGDQVIIEKGGDVIPKVVRVIESLRTGQERPFEFPRECPVCGGALVRDLEEAAHRCVNASCPAQVKGRILHYAGRNAMDIDGLGEKMVDQLVDGGSLHDIADLYHLSRGFLAQMERMGEKSGPITWSPPSPPRAAVNRWPICFSALASATSARPPGECWPARTSQSTR